MGIPETGVTPDGPPLLIFMGGLGGASGEIKEGQGMACLGCNLIETSPVDLRDGRMVCNCCPDWRHECLARDLAKYESNEKRKAFMGKYEARHGAEMAKQLRTDVGAIMKAAA